MKFWSNKSTQGKHRKKKPIKRWIVTCCSMPSAAMTNSGKQRGLWQTTCSERIVGMSYCTLNSWTRSSLRVPRDKRLERKGRGGPVQLVAEVTTVWALIDSGQASAQCINSPCYINHQSPSTCCLQKASMVFKPRSPSGCFQVSSSRTSCTHPDTTAFLFT